MNMHNGCWVYTTVPNMKLAKKIARIVVKGRFAACANIIPKIHSIYWWDKEICEDQEIAVIFKTVAANFAKLSSEIKRHHPYSCPSILSIPWSTVDPTFMNWINAATKLDQVDSD